jgi:hypothetical protein
VPAGRIDQARELRDHQCPEQPDVERHHGQDGQRIGGPCHDLGLDAAPGLHHVDQRLQAGLQPA